MPSAVPTTLTSSMRRRSAGSRSTTSEEISRPALLIRMSSPPSSSTVAATACSQLASSVTSRCVKPVVAPVLPMSFAVSVPSSSRRSPIITAAPAACQRLRHALPQAAGTPGDQCLPPVQFEDRHPALLVVESSPARWPVGVMRGHASCCLWTTVKTFLDTRQELSRAVLRPGDRCVRAVSTEGGPWDPQSPNGSRDAPSTRSPSAAASSPPPRSRRSPSWATPARASATSPRTPSSRTASCTTTSATRST